MRAAGIIGIVGRQTEEIGQAGDDLPFLGEAAATATTAIAVTGEFGQRCIPFGAVFLLALITLCPQLLCEFWNGAYCSGPFVGKLPGSAIFLGGFRDVDRFRLGA